MRYGMGSRISMFGNAGSNHREERSRGQGRRREERLRANWVCFTASH